MTVRGGYDWIDRSDGSWDVYSGDQKIANLRQNSGGYWYVTSDPGTLSADGLELARLIHLGKRIGL
jgi:hypothetical protein